ncbi:MAG: glucose 1-dehydrogenase [Planctomycetaceae bacterium]|nr:glucose 1-dehydrogenase [Planctomycetaceae bacterium]
MRFQGQTVLVTGGAKGIGRGCCQVFHAEGALVGLLDRDAETGATYAAELNAVRPGSACFVACDVSREEELQRAIDQVVRQFGRLDCLINNAGIHPPATPIEDFTCSEMEHLMRVNFLSTYAASRLALPYLRQTQGTIINISSMTAVLGQHLSTAYAATKGAQVSFTKALAIEAADAGVRVNAVLPSNVDTPLMREWADTLDDPATALQRVAELQVFRRMAAPEEIGRICLFLATPDSSFLTGQAIEADGGAALDY